MAKKDIESILESYPRTRPPISAEHEEVFVEEYKLNRSRGGILYNMIKALESWSHKMIAQKGGSESLLEIGAGTLNHIPYESKVSEYDIIEPFEELYKDSPHLDQVERVYEYIEDVPGDKEYERIISKAVLEHLTDLPKVIARSALHLDQGGVFQASIPTEGGFLWGLSWRATTAIAYRLRTGLDYKTIMRHEHINSAPEILAVVRYFYDDVRIWRFPLPMFHLSFYTYIEARNPKLESCRTFLESSR